MSREWVHETLHVVAGQTTREDHLRHSTTLYNKNMKAFINAVNEWTEQGWEPQGAPSFTGKWLQVPTDPAARGVAIQAMVRHTSKKSKR